MWKSIGGVLFFAVVFLVTSYHLLHSGEMIIREARKVIALLKGDDLPRQDD